MFAHGIRTLQVLTVKPESGMRSFTGMKSTSSGMCALFANSTSLSLEGTRVSLFPVFHGFWSL